MFYHNFKHLEVRQVYFTTRGVFTSLLGVWKFVKTRSIMFDKDGVDSVMFNTMLNDQQRK